jgi:hypothetical protein
MVWNNRMGEDYTRETLLKDLYEYDICTNHINIKQSLSSTIL